MRWRRLGVAGRRCDGCKRLWSAGMRLQATFCCVVRTARCERGASGCRVWSAAGHSWKCGLCEGCVVATGGHGARQGQVCERWCCFAWEARWSLRQEFAGAPCRSQSGGGACAMSQEFAGILLVTSAKSYLLTTLGGSSAEFIGAPLCDERKRGARQSLRQSRASITASE